METKIKLNFGAGDTKLDGFVNIDMNISVKPDLITDIRLHCLPFQDASCEVIHFLHCLEHIELKFWPFVFDEFYRLLMPNGVLLLAFPNFEICSTYFLENYRGMREFWCNTLYGRQLYAGDYHVTGMLTPEVINWLERFGFINIRYAPEPEEWNIFIKCQKGIRYTREDIL